MNKLVLLVENLPAFDTDWPGHKKVLSRRDLTPTYILLTPNVKSPDNSPIGRDEKI